MKKEKLKDNIKQPKKKDKVQYVQLPSQFNNVESARLGEMYLTSEVLRADQLLSLLIQALRIKEVEKYLGLVDKKKAGAYYG